jgi:hypothetical protein
MGSSVQRWLLVLAVLYSTASAYTPPVSVWKPPSNLFGNVPKEQPRHQQEPEGDLISRCKLHWRNATLDHFTWVRGIVQTSFLRFFNNFLAMHHACTFLYTRYQISVNHLYSSSNAKQQPILLLFVWYLVW